MAALDVYMNGFLVGTFSKEDTGAHRLSATKIPPNQSDSIDWIFDWVLSKEIKQLLDRVKDKYGFT